MIWIPLILILPYLILLLAYYSKLSEAVPFTEKAESSVFVSVIIPCHNEELNISPLLYNISRQNYNADLFEVIVVNDNSTDRTLEIATQYSGIQKIKVVNNEGKGKKSAIRTGISISQGELIVTTDADCSMGTNWIRIIASYYKQHNSDMIICPVQIESGSGFFRRFQEIEFLSLQGITAGSALSGKAIMCNGANLAFSKQIYLSHSSDLHDEINSGDDIFLLHSLKREKNPKILWIESQEAIVTTKASNSVGSFLRQRKRWISKGKYYSDRDTIVTAAITFIAVLLQATLFISSFFSTVFIPAFLTIFILKSIPDYLIIRSTAIRYGNKDLIRWFIPAQIIYPFYVIIVVFRKNKSAFRNPQSEIL